MRKIILILFFGLFCFGMLCAQQIKHYNNNSGLSHNTVMSLYQDSKGFMWIGTKNGLNRFDGHDFKIYQRGDSVTELRNSMIYCITEDKEKKLWIATDNGVALYNPFTEAFSDFDKQTDKEEKVEGYTNKIYIDQADRVWILSGRGLFVYKPSEDKLYNLKEKFAPYTDYAPWALFVDDNGVAYLGFPNIGVIKYDIEADKTTYLSHNDNLPTVICGYKDKYILLGTRDKGVFLIDKETGGQEKLPIDESLDSDVYVRHIEKISKDEYWIGTESGIYVLENGKTRHIIHEDYNDLSISNNAVYAICKDKEGGIWIGSYFGGVDYIPKQYSYFENFYPIAYKNSIDGYRVREFVSDKSGNLWIATEDNGLNYYDTHTGLFTHISEKTKPVGLSFSNIQCLNLSGDKLWIGTFSRGVDVLDLKTNRCRHYEKDGMPNSILNNDIFAIYTDSRNTTWVGSTTELYTYVPEIDGFRRFEPMNGAFISDILEDTHGYIWFTTYNVGIVRYNPDTKEVRRFRYDVEDPNSLCYDRITCVFQDSKQRLWFASEDNGFCRYNESDGTFTRITTRQGLPSNVIYKILEDDNQCFWLSTINGLVSFNPETMRVEALYNLPNGLRNKQFNYNSGIKTEDGTLYFGNIDGFVAFNPKNFHPNKNKYSVVLTGFYIFNQQVKGEMAERVLDKAIPYASAIRLDYDQATFSFSFSALNYSTEGNGKYAYMLEGIDKKWNYVDNVFRISYNSIPPGDYVFHIKYSKDGSDWSDTDTTINISIIPPLWQSSWAYALYAILIVGICFAVVRMYVLKKKRQVEERMARQEQEKKEEIYKAKIDFFTNVAHEIRTPITLIKAPLDYILTSHPDENETKENLITMERNTDRLLVLVNQLLDFRKIESKAFTLSLKVRNINVLVTNTFNRFVPTGKRKNLNMILESPGHAVMALVDEEAITKVCSNLFNNAVKYSATYIKAILSVSDDSRSFRITVKNDGTPIPPDMRERIFEAFFQLKAGAHPTQPGSGIGLTLASSLVQLHNGKLYLDEEAEDTSFVVEIPTNASAGMQQVEGDVLIENVAADENDTWVGIPDDSFAAKDVVLVVEDNEELQQFLSVQLGKFYKVLTAHNGMEAMEILKKEIVNLIISDIMMPLKDGLELCNEIKSDLETCHIPIILLTAKTTLHNKIEGLNSGADAYIEKPFAMSYLLAQIKNLLESRMKLRQNFANSPYIATNSMAQNKADEDFLNKLTEVIRQNLDNEEFNIDDLAKEVNMSRTSLHRKIKVITELTPGDFIRIIRLKRAAELLLEGEYRINEICMIVGIRSLSYFSKSFQKQFGVLPKDFAKSHMKQ